MEDVEMASIGGKKLSVRERKRATMTKEQFSLYISNKIRRNKNRAERKWKTEQIEQLESVDNRLHGRLRNLKIEKEKVIDDIFF